MLPKYEHLRLLYPPRAKGAINPAEVTKYSGFIAQYKYNDIRTVVYIFPDRHVEFYNRYKQPHAAYAISPAMRKSLEKLRLPAGHFYVLDGGLLRSKTRHLRDRLILWDILVYKSEYLIGTTYSERYKLLYQIAGSPRRYETETKNKLAYKISETLWLAPVFKTDLPTVYSKLIHLDEIEGLLLKNPQGRLSWATRLENNGSWQIRVRKPSANYRF